MRRVRQWRAATAIVVLAVLAPSEVVLGESATAGIGSGAVATEPATRLGVVPAAVGVTGTRVGPIRLGQTPTVVVAYFEGLLGAAPSVDVLRLDSAVLRGCFGGTRVAVYEWAGVRLVFVGDSSTTVGEYTLFDFRLDGRATSNGLQGFESSRGARIGDPLDRWNELHPDATYVPEESDVIGPTLTLGDGLIALVDPATGRVTSVSAVSPVFCE